jgi:penicillin-binding protein 1C
LDYDIQQRSVAIMNRWAGRFAEQGIHNGACVVLDTATGELLAYIGNVAIAGIDAEANAASVDIASSPRSSGSLLKPFLYAALLDTGAILPSSLVSDIPTRVGSYHPENNSRSYLGVVPADAALARSLNVPAVRELRLYGVDRFAQLLLSLGLTTLWRRGEDYGLPLILGGAEVTLEEIAHLYAGLSSHYLSQRHKGHKGEEGGEKKVFISEGAAWLALEALTFVTRPGEDSHWQEYANSRRIAWKTGTSFGNRDAWAVGTRPDYTVGVWIGNATGEGRPGLVSTATSAPVLFEIFSALDSMKRGSVPWFPRPDEELFSVEVCALSGFPAGPDCASSKAQSVPKNAPLAKSCPYCRLVALNESGTARVALGEDASGYAARVVQKKWFVLPPAEEWYYRRWNLDYKPLPPFEGASDAGSVQSIALFNPEENGAVYVPRELEGREGRIVFQAATRNASGKIFWHLDDAFLGTTESFHEMEARPGPGLHIVTLVDENGATLRRWFTVLGEAD